MEWWTRVRLEVLRGEKSKRGVLRDEGIHWETLKKIMRYSEPPGYRLQEARPKPRIGAYLERIPQIIEEDKALPKKQRHTAKRIYERIREMGYEGKYTQVKEAVRELIRLKQEVFMPLIHRPGEGQVDFGHALAKVSGRKRPSYSTASEGSVHAMPSRNQSDAFQAEPLLLDGQRRGELSYLRPVAGS